MMSTNYSLRERSTEAAMRCGSDETAWVACYPLV